MWLGTFTFGQKFSLFAYQSYCARLGQVKGLTYKCSFLIFVPFKGYKGGTLVALILRGGISVIAIRYRIGRELLCTNF